MTAPGWWRRNRVALIALPALLALAMAANGQRAVQYWWPADAHERIESDPDGSVSLRNTSRDANGPYRQQMRVQVVDTAPTTTVEDFPGDAVEDLTVPADLRVWRITLHVTAPPDDILAGCQVRVLDEQDREYAPGVRLLDPSGPSDLSSPCTPADDPGPDVAFAPGPVEPASGLDGDEDPRAPEYDVYLYVIMPEDREPDRLRVWFQLPEYAELPLSPQTG